jgi:DNA polymerase-3 subunit beta
VKLSLDRKAFASALKTASVPTVSNHLPILGGLHVDAVKGRAALTGTNLDLTVALDLEADVEEAGAVVLPGRVLAALVDKAEGDTVEITVEAGRATVESGPTVATLHTFAVEDWPKVTPADGKRFELSAADLERIAGGTGCAGSGKDLEGGRHMLGGVHFLGNQARTASTLRCAIAQLGVNDLPDQIVPMDVVQRVLKASPGGVTMTFDPRSVTFDAADGNITWTSRLIPGAFPKVENIVRKDSPYQLVMPREPLAEALNRVRLLADDGGDFRPVDLTRDGNAVLIRSARADVGDIVEEVPCSGDWVKPLRLHDGNLLALLAAMDSDDITLEVEDAMKIVQARTADRRLVVGIMPMRPPA